MLNNIETVCPFFSNKIEGEVNKIYCSSNNNSLYFSKLDKDKYKILYTYCCCSEIGCRKCSAYKYLKDKEKSQK